MNRRRTKGQSLVEFALLIPLIILLFTVFLDIGRGVYYYISLTSAVREGARYATVNPTQTAVQRTAVETVIRNKMQSVNTTELTITVTPPNPCCDIMRIQARLRFRPVTPGLQGFVRGGNGIPLNVNTAVRVAPVALPRN